MRDSLTSNVDVDPMMLIQDLDFAIDQISHVTAKQSDRLGGPTCAGRRVLPASDGRDAVFGRVDTASAGKRVRCASQDADTDDGRDTHASPPTGAVIDCGDRSSTSTTTTDEEEHEWQWAQQQRQQTTTTTDEEEHEWQWEQQQRQQGQKEDEQQQQRHAPQQ